MKFTIRAILLATVAATPLGCIVPLQPGAAQVTVTTNAQDVLGCTDVGNVSAISGNNTTIHVHQMQNQALTMDADTVFQSGTGGIAYRCKPSTKPPK